MKTNAEVKAFYAGYHDQIRSKRFDSPHRIRRMVHRDIYGSVVDKVPAGVTTLDAGSGEGVLSLMLAENGVPVVGVDYSTPNVKAAIKTARSAGFDESQVRFQVGDAEALPFPDNSFDCVLSNHVLEHLPNFQKGITELFRVTRDRAVISVPTCLNPCAWALLGGDVYWTLTKRSVYAVPLGIGRVLQALCIRGEGVNQGYGGDKDNVHIFRFPWVMKSELRRAGFRILSYEAQSLCTPYVKLRLRHGLAYPVLWDLGVGTVFVVQKDPDATGNSVRQSSRSSEAV
jgi:ubiquinone/menaquinone biosynthesis C-methylase UbiE